MFRPMIYAPMPSPKRLAKSLSGPVVPPVCPLISRNPRVPTYQPCSSSPPTPSGFSRSCRGPAPYPSSEIAKLWTRSLDMESSVCFICVELVAPKSTCEGPDGRAKRHNSAEPLRRVGSIHAWLPHAVDPHPPHRGAYAHLRSRLCGRLRRCAHPLVHRPYKQTHGLAQSHPRQRDQREHRATKSPPHREAA